MAVVSEDKESPRCSFCGKRREQVANLIAGPGVFICVECVDLCNHIIGRQGPRADLGRAVSQAMAEKAVEPLDGPLDELRKSLSALQDTALRLPEAVADVLAQRLHPAVSEVVAHLACPHCGKRLDEPVEASAKPVEGPLAEA
jgi:hypothetical protein